PYPYFPLFCLRVRPGGALHLISSILSKGAPRSSPTPDLSTSVCGCAPAPPYSLFNLFCLWVRPGEALPLIYSILFPGAPQRPLFSLFCPRVRPGAALDLVFPLLSAGAPRRCPTPDLSNSVSGRSPAQPYPYFPLFCSGAHPETEEGKIGV
ncbi:hypothetical protein CDAR_549681, partial [Caerostris darwini]